MDRSHCGKLTHVCQLTSCRRSLCRQSYLGKLMAKLLEVTPNPAPSKVSVYDPGPRCHQVTNPLTSLRATALVLALMMHPFISSISSLPY